MSVAHAYTCWSERVFSVKHDFQCLLHCTSLNYGTRIATDTFTTPAPLSYVTDTEF